LTVRLAHTHNTVGLCFMANVCG